MAELEQGLEELKVVKQAFKNNFENEDIPTQNIEFRNMPNLLKGMEKKLPHQIKSVRPTTAEQSVTADSGYKLTEVKVNAVNPADYYKPEQSVNVSPKTTSQTIRPQGNVVYNTVNVEAVTSGIDANIIPTNIRKGKTILGVQGNLEADKPDQQKTVNPTTTQQSVVADSGYELAKVTVNAVTSNIDSNIKSSNIKKGVSILGVTGTLEESTSTTISLQEKTINPTTEKQSVVADAGYDGLGKVNVEAVVPSDYYKPEEVANVTPTTSEQKITPSSNAVFKEINVSAVTSAIDGNIVPENIKKDVTILGVTGTMEATAGGSSKFAELVDGSIVAVEESDLADVQLIRANAFRDITNLQSVAVPSNVQTIGASAFEGCSSLTTLSLAEGVEVIGASAFEGINVGAIQIPNSVLSLGEGAFANNTALTSATIGTGITQLPADLFNGCTSLTEVTLQSLTAPSVTDTTFPSNVTAIYVLYGAYDSYMASWTNYKDKIVRLPAIPSTITVTVDNYLGEIMSGTSVTIEGNGQTFTGTTNESGVFVQGDLQPATYTITVSDVDGFKKPQAVEVEVVEDSQNTVTITYLEVPAFSEILGENTWAIVIDIANIISANKMTSQEVYNTYGWRVGDTIDLPLSTGEVRPSRILGFNQDILSDGSGTAGITFETVDCLNTKYTMGNSKNGWIESTMRTVTLPAIKATLPVELQKAIKTVIKNTMYIPSYGTYNKYTTTDDELFVLSVRELAGTRSDPSYTGQDYENEQYEYWAQFSITREALPERVKKVNGVASVWHTRSGGYTVNGETEVKENGRLYGNSDGSKGVSFAFCI